jgi:hypothetical protein
MALPLAVWKDEETTAACVYAFGPAPAPDAPPPDTAGRVRLQKASGDIEVLALPDPDDGANPRFLLAQAVSRLQAYHEAGAYPAHDRWAA